MPGRLSLQGTTYQKTDAAVEMKRINREQFWEQAKVCPHSRPPWLLSLLQCVPSHILPQLRE